MLQRKPIYNIVALILAVVLVVELVILWNKYHSEQQNNPPHNMVNLVQIH